MVKFSEKPPKSASENNASSTAKTKKITWYSGVVKWVKKIAAIIRDVISLIGELIQHLLDLITFTFSVAVKIGVNPVAPIICAIILFLLVVAVTLNQWWQVGAWVAKVIRIPVSLGIFSGLLFGIGINIFQLTPKLRKLSRAINRAYVRLGVNPEYESEDTDNPAQLEQNWLSENHRKSKVWSAVSYCAETAFVVVFVFIAEKLATLAIIQAIISLVLPEKTLDLASNTISLMGAVSRQVAYEEPPESEVNL